MSVVFLIIIGAFVFVFAWLGLCRVGLRLGGLQLLGVAIIIIIVIFKEN